MEEQNIEAKEPSVQPNNEIHQKSENKGIGTKILLGILIAAVAGLYILHFSNGKSKENPEATPAVVSEGGIKVAYINTDSLMAKYKYALDLEKELQVYQSNKETSYQRQLEQLLKEEQDYLKTGANLTLSQQKAKEEEFQRREAELQQLQITYTQQIQEKTLQESEKMTNAVYAFIREYNEANQQFDIILSKSFSNTPILYGNPGMDITNEIIEGLNKEYESIKE
mgnify:FL=1